MLKGNERKKRPPQPRYRLSKVRQKRPHAPKRKTDLGNFSGTFGSLQNCHACFSLAPYGGLFYYRIGLLMSIPSWMKRELMMGGGEGSAVYFNIRVLLWVFVQ